MKHLNLAVLFGLILIVSLNAQPRQRFAKFPPEKEMCRLMLNEEQQEKADQLRIEHQEKMLYLRNELSKADLEIEKLMLEENYSMTDLKKLMDGKREIRNKMEDERFNHWTAVYQLLDDDQKELWEKRFSFRKGGFGKGYGMGKHQHRMQCLN
ncbi:MAG: hypothetical protein CMF23_04320 [Ignavibacteriae bacterium]|nr:hypothetical protein [Ignavibacteriota bacterium]